MMKKCSIVWVGLKSGIKWVDGDFSKTRSIASSEALQTLQDEFDQKNDYSNDWNQKIYSRQARKFLEQHGFNVTYNDFDIGFNESMTEKEADEFVKKLRKTDSVKFKYKKVDGSTRTANGTLKKDLLPKRGDVDKARRRHHIPNSIIVYWDLDKESFRCFKKKLFVGYA